MNESGSSLKAPKPAPRCPRAHEPALIAAVVDREEPTMDPSDSSGGLYDRPWDRSNLLAVLQEAESPYEPPWDRKPQPKPRRSVSSAYDPPWDPRPSSRLLPDSEPCYEPPWEFRRTDEERWVAAGPPWQVERALQHLQEKVRDARPDAASPQNSLRSSLLRESKETKEPDVRLSEFVDVNLPLERQKWYHGPIRRKDAEQLLMNRKAGSYLVRKTESGRSNEYSLSIRALSGNCIHMKIVEQQQGQYILGQSSQPFASVPAMVSHYSQKEIPIKGAEHMTLLHPIEV